MITYGRLEVTARYYGSKAVAEVRKGLRLVWLAIRSCFGRGFWANEKPWSNTDGWRNM